MEKVLDETPLLIYKVFDVVTVVASESFTVNKDQGFPNTMG